MPKYRKMLSNWDAPYIQAIVKLVETQSKATLVAWATDYSEKVFLPIWEKSSPGDMRPQAAIDAARAWLRGDIKLPVAKPVILQCHEAAREMINNPTAQAAVRAIGQAASTIHSATHCMGLPLYGAPAAAYDALGVDTPWPQLEAYAAGECGRMLSALNAIAVKDEKNKAKVNWQC